MALAIFTFWRETTQTACSSDSRQKKKS